MSLVSILLVVLLVALIVGLLPTWPHSANLGPYPSGLLVVILIVVLLWLLLGRGFG